MFFLPSSSLATLASAAALSRTVPITMLVESLESCRTNSNYRSILSAARSSLVLVGTNSYAPVGASDKIGRHIVLNVIDILSEKLLASKTIDVYKFWKMVHWSGRQIEGKSVGGGLAYM